MTEPTKPAFPQPSDEARLIDVRQWYNLLSDREKARQTRTFVFLMRILSARDAELDAARSEIATLAGQIDALQAQIKEVSHEADSWNAKYCEARAEIATLQGRIEDMEADAANDYGNCQSIERAFRDLCEAVGIERGTTNWDKWIEGVRQQFARLRSAAPSGDLRAENERLRQAVEFAHGWIAGLPGTMPAGFEDKRAAQKALEGALASPQPDAGAKGEVEEDTKLDTFYPGWFLRDARKAEERSQQWAAPSPSPEAAPPSGDAMEEDFMQEVRRLGMPINGNGLVPQVTIIEGRLRTAFRVALTRRDRAAAEKMREAVLDLARRKSWPTWMRDCISALPLPPDAAAETKEMG